MQQETDYLLVGQAARLLQRPDHQVRRTVDQIWPNVPRSGRFRMIRRDQLCELGAAIVERFGPSADSDSSSNKTTDAV